MIPTHPLFMGLHGVHLQLTVEPEHEYMPPMRRHRNHQIANAQTLPGLSGDYPGRTEPQVSGQAAPEDCMNPALQIAIDEGRRLGKKALYFGCWDNLGHFLYDIDGHCTYTRELTMDFPWDACFIDTGLLKNRKVPDIPDGRVHWTCGGARAFWYAFVWWDRSVDGRGACNSGFYVRGFGWPESQAAFEYACSQFPHVVARQKYPLVLQEHL